MPNLTHLGARVAGREARPEKGRRVAGAVGVPAGARDVVEALVVEHADCGARGEVAHLAAAGTLARTAAGVRLQAALLRGPLVRVVAAVFLLAFVRVAAVAFFARLHYAIATQGAIVLFN